MRDSAGLQRQGQRVRWLGAGLLAMAGGGALGVRQVMALSDLPLWGAVLLAQGLALAAVAGVVILAVPPPGQVHRR